MLAGPEQSVYANLRLKSWLDTLESYRLTPASISSGTGMRRVVTMVCCNCCMKRRASVRYQMALEVLSALHQGGGPRTNFGD